MRPGPEDGPLPGGTANHGRVIRVGDTVHRPCGNYTAATHALLRHLARSGFAGSPRILRVDDRVEVLAYIEGRSATEPFAPWALTTDALVSVGELLRDFHEHSRPFDGASLRWQRPVPEPWRGGLVTHNDVNPANVIFRDGRAVALIDFDLAAPGCAAFDLAVTACFWAPLRDEDDIADTRHGHSLARFRDLLAGYGASAALRHDVVDACADANEWIAAIIHDASRHGHPAFGRVWANQAQMYARAQRWLHTHRGRLADAVR